MPAACDSRDHSKKSTLVRPNPSARKVSASEVLQTTRPRDSRGPHRGAAYLFGFSDEPKARSSKLREIPSSAVTVLANLYPGADVDHGLDVISEGGSTFGQPGLSYSDRSTPRPEGNAMTSRRTALKLGAVVAGSFMINRGALAADSIRLIVPWGKGSTAEQIYQLIQEPFAKAMGMPVIIDYVTGDGSKLATQETTRYRSLSARAQIQDLSFRHSWARRAEQSGRCQRETRLACKRRSNNPSLKRPDNLVAPE